MNIVKTIIFSLLFLSLSSLSYAQDSLELEVHPDENFLELPKGWNFGEVAAIEITGQGNIIVFHRGGHKLLKFNSEGKFIKELGQGLFVKPHGLRVDADGNIWTTDGETHYVLKLDPEGRILMVLGKIGGSGSDRNDLLFKAPTDVGFDGAGNIYVTDGGNNRIVKFTSSGKLITAWGSKGIEAGQFDLPHAVLIDKNNQVYIADRNNKRIQIFDLEGKFLKAWTEIGYAYNLVFDQDQTIWMTDARADRVVHLDKDGNIVGGFGTFGKNPGEFSSVHGLAVTPEGAIFTTEIYNWRVQKFEILQ